MLPPAGDTQRLQQARGARSNELVMLRRLVAWRPGGYLRASGVLFVWLMLRAAAQAAQVLLLAQLLGAEGYGLFVTVLAVASFFTPVAGFGLGGLLLRDGAREPEKLAERLSMALALWCPVAFLCTLVAVPVITWVLPAPLPLLPVSLFAVSEIAASSFIEFAARVEQSQHRARAFGIVQGGGVFIRLAALLIYAAIHHPEPVGWLWVYALSGLIYAAAVAWRVVARYRPAWPAKRDWSMARESFPFTIGALSFRVQAEFNKPVLALASFGHAGNFSVAQRVVEFAGLPLQAMLEALWSRLYASACYEQRLLRTGSALIFLALLGGMVLYGLAPWLPALVGPTFTQAVDMIRWLAWLPAMQVLRSLLNFRLTVPGRTHLLTWVYAATALVNILLTARLVAAYGLYGAAMALYGGELALILALWVVPRVLGDKK